MAFRLRKVFGTFEKQAPARIAYGPHTGILSIARARSELKQLCCCINPDFSVKMSNIPNFVTRKKKKKKKKKKKGKRKSVVVI